MANNSWPYKQEYKLDPPYGTTCNAEVVIGWMTSFGEPKNINWEEAHIGAFENPIAYPTPSINPPFPVGQAPPSFGGSTQHAPQPSGFTVPSVGYGQPHAGMAPTGHSAFQLAFGAGRADNPLPSSGRKSNNSRRGSRSKNRPNRPSSATRGRGSQEERYVPQYSEYTKLVDTQENIFVATEQQVHYRRP